MMKKFGFLDREPPVQSSIKAELAMAAVGFAGVFIAYWAQELSFSDEQVALVAIPSCAFLFILKNAVEI